MRAIDLIRAAVFFAMLMGSATICRGEQELFLLGPYTFETTQGNFEATITGRDGDLLLLNRRTLSGEIISSGVDVEMIVLVHGPPADEIDERFFAYRDVPGIRVDEVLLSRAVAHETQGQFEQAVLLYEEMLSQPYHERFAHWAEHVDLLEAVRWQCGIAYSELGRYDEAIALLSRKPVPDEDVEMLSSIYWACARAYAALEEHERAILDYLYLAVFYPQVNSNEERCLEAVVPLYEALR